jgi:hypothetical protein
VASEKVVRGHHLSTGSAAAACLAYLPAENRINQRVFPAAIRQMNTASIELTCGIFLISSACCNSRSSSSVSLPIPGLRMTLNVPGESLLRSRATTSRSSRLYSSSSKTGSVSMSLMVLSPLVVVHGLGREGREDSAPRFALDSVTCLNILRAGLGGVLNGSLVGHGVNCSLSRAVFEEECENRRPRGYSCGSLSVAQCRLCHWQSARARNEVVLLY